MPENQLRLIDYATGKCIENFEPELTPHYLSCAQTIGKELIVAGATNKGKVKIVDRHKKVSVASLTDMPNVFDIDVVKKTLPGGAHRFTVTSNNNLVTLEFKK